MKRLSPLFLLTLGLATSSAWAAGFTAGNIVVLRTSATATAGNPGALLEYDPAVPNTIVQTVTLPDTGANAVVFGNPSGNLAHSMTRSGDGAWLAIPGYGNYFTAIDTATAANCPRVVTLMKYDGTTLSRVTATSTALSGIIPRGGASDGFGNCWVMGASGGTVWMNGSVINSSSTGRGVLVVDGRLYYSTSAGVYSFDEGLPTTAAGAPRTQIMTASSMGATPDPAGLAIAPNGGTIAYVANYQGNLGIGRYDWNGSSWVWSYNITFGETGAPSIAVDFSQSPPLIYVTTLTKVIKFSDPGTPGGAATTTTLATVASPVKFRSVALAPVQPACAVFTTPPGGVTNDYGSTVVFGPVVATGANPNGFTWTRYGTNLVDGPTGTGSIISGATSNTLTVANIGLPDQTNYYAVAHNSGPCATTSAAAYLKLQGSCINPQIVSITVTQGTDASFAAGTSGCQTPLAFSWYRNDSPISDGTGPSGLSTYAGTATGTLWITNAQVGDMGTYKVTVLDGNSDSSSSIATLTVTVQPYFTQDPANQSKLGGQNATFAVAAEGNALSYRWHKDTVAINDGPSGTGSIRAGTQTPTLWITNVSTADVGSYTCTVSNISGTATCNPATLTVGYLPVITGPVSLVVTAGHTAVFAATVTGSAPISYSWTHNTTTLFDDSKYSGTITDTLTITDVQVGDAQSYTVTAQNAYGSASATAVLRFVYALPQAHTVPGLVIYENFNYPEQANPPFPTPNTFILSWQDLISAWNEATGQPAWWERLDPRPYSSVDSTENQYGISKSGYYPWRGLDCAVTREWYSSSAPNNNHLMFGGIDQTNGAAYFSFVVGISQSIPLADEKYDVIAGLTTGTGLANADNWVFKICTQNNTAGQDGYKLGVFKGWGSSISASSVNGQWTDTFFDRGSMHFIVGCYKFNSGTNLVSGSITNDDVLSLWIDPPRSTFGAAEAPAPTLGGMITNWAPNAPITEFAIKGLVPPTTRRYADLRIGTNWSSVTPPFYPTIQYTWDGSNLGLAWEGRYTKGPGFHSSGYELWESPDLVTWTKSGNVPYLDGSQAKVAVSAGTGPFFQLRY